MRASHAFYVLTLLALTPVAARAADAPAYTPKSTGTTELFGGALTIMVLVEEANLGSAEVEVGEITFPADYQGGGHRHGAIEIFYVLEGTMDHVVNDVPHRLTPGMVGIVRPHDMVTHKVVGNAPVKAVVIWAPGGEVGRLKRVFQERPVDD